MAARSTTLSMRSSTGTWSRPAIRTPKPPAAPRQEARPGPDQRADRTSSLPTGLLFFASYPERDNVAAASNPHIIGALFTIYWSNLEPADGNVRLGGNRPADRPLDQCREEGRAAHHVVVERQLARAGRQASDAPVGARPRGGHGPVRILADRHPTHLGPGLPQVRHAVSPGGCPQVRWRSQRPLHRRDTRRRDQPLPLPTDQRPGAGVQAAVRKYTRQRRDASIRTNSGWRR